jgi:hypothetical protein
MPPPLHPPPRAHFAVTVKVYGSLGSRPFAVKEALECAGLMPLTMADCSRLPSRCANTAHKPRAAQRMQLGVRV